MKSIQFLTKALRGGLHQIYTQEKATVAQLNEILKKRPVLISNKKYKKCHAVVQEYYFDCGKEYLRVFVNNQITEFVEFDDCEFM